VKLVGNMMAMCDGLPGETTRDSTGRVVQLNIHPCVRIHITCTVLNTEQSTALRIGQKWLVADLEKNHAHHTTRSQRRRERWDRTRTTRLT